MNSNPWGLFQMNSEATGQKADAATIKTIDNACLLYTSHQRLRGLLIE